MSNDIAIVSNIQNKTTNRDRRFKQQNKNVELPHVYTLGRGNKFVIN